MIKWQSEYKSYFGSFPELLCSLTLKNKLVSLTEKIEACFLKNWDLGPLLNSMKYEILVKISSSHFKNE